jgi:hypothetical protein
MRGVLFVKHRAGSSVNIFGTQVNFCLNFFSTPFRISKFVLAATNHKTVIEE